VRRDIPDVSADAWNRAYAAMRLSLRRERFGVLERNGDDPTDPLARGFERDLRTLEMLVTKARRFDAEREVQP